MVKLSTLNEITKGDDNNDCIIMSIANNEKNKKSELDL